MVRKILPQALIHLASTNKMCNLKGKNAVHEQQKQPLTHIRKNAEVKLNHNTHTALSKYNKMFLHG